MVPIGLAEPGTGLEVDAPSGRVSATVVTMPFIDPKKEIPKQQLSAGT
jgi:aminomethyltransferase